MKFERFFFAFFQKCCSHAFQRCQGIPLWLRRQSVGDFVFSLTSCNVCVCVCIYICLKLSRQKCWLYILINAIVIQWREEKNTTGIHLIRTYVFILFPVILYTHNIWQFHFYVCICVHSFRLLKIIADQNMMLKKRPLATSNELTSNESALIFWRWHRLVDKQI